MIRRLAFPAALLPLLLAGCGLQPLYGGGSASPVATTLAAVEVAPISGNQAGWLVRNALNDRLHHQAVPARYRLEVELDDQITGLGVRADNAITRERRTLRARYRLVDAANGGVVLDQTASAVSGIDVAASEYATVAAEQTALERLTETLADEITARLATYARRAADKAAPAQP